MKDKKLSTEKIIDNLLLEEYEYHEDMPKRKQQILDAAIKVFSEKGFQGSRTSEIAKEANVSEGTIFNYYKCKKDLLIGLLIRIIVEFVKPIVNLTAETINEGGEKENVERVMHKLLLDRLELVRDNYQLIKIILIESVYHPELLDILSKELYPKLIEIIDTYVEENIQKGHFRNIEKRVISRSVISSIIGFIILSNVVPEYFGGKNDNEEIKKIVDVVLYGIANEKYK